MECQSLLEYRRPSFFAAATSISSVRRLLTKQVRVLHYFFITRFFALSAFVPCHSPRFFLNPQSISIKKVVFLVFFFDSFSTTESLPQAKALFRNALACVLGALFCYYAARLLFFGGVDERHRPLILTCVSRHATLAPLLRRLLSLAGSAPLELSF